MSCEKGGDSRVMGADLYFSQYCRVDPQVLEGMAHRH